jgi:hypothetical protein
MYVSKKAFHNTLDEIQTAINAVIAALTDEYVVAFHYVLWRVVFMLCIAPMKTVLESLHTSLLIGPALREAGLLMLGSPLHKVINNLTAEFLRAELIERSEMLIEFLAHDTPREFDREAEAFMKLPTTLTLTPDERLRQLANHLMGLTASLFSRRVESFIDAHRSYIVEKYAAALDQRVPGLTDADAAGVFQHVKPDLMARINALKANQAIFRECRR